MLQFVAPASKNKSMILYSDFIKKGNHIGHGGTMFTLWYAESPDTDGMQRIHFIKNISKEKESVELEHPNVPFTELKGESWNEFVEREDLTKSLNFPFGKYMGNVISECKDLKYLEWFFNSMRNESAQQVLLSNGYEFLDGALHTPEQIAEYKEDAMIEAKYADGEFEVMVVSNITSPGENIVVKVINEDFTEEKFRYGKAFNIDKSSEFVDLISWRSYHGFEYGVLKGWGRSMKMKEAVIKIKGGYIVDMHLLK